MTMQRNRAGIQRNMLTNIFRKLWVQHVMWTRSFIISTAHDLPDLDMVTKRLLRNPSDFATVLAVFYGTQKADKFKDLLEQHLLIAADLVNSAKAGNSDDVDKYEKKWYANAEEIATFLSQINPYWSKDEWQHLLFDHLRMTETEAVLRLNGQYAEDIKIYDSIEDQAMQMADYMASGIQRQFF